MYSIKYFWLSLSLYWKRGSSAEVTRLSLLNEALHNEGKFLNSISPTVPYWRVLALRGEQELPFSPQKTETPKEATSSPPLDHINYQLVLTVPEYMFKLQKFY